jgi:hypothetical protein
MTQGRLPTSPLAPSLTMRQRCWHNIFCRGNGCRHGPGLTWLCIELFLAKVPGSTGLLDRDYGTGSTRLVEYQLSQALEPGYANETAVNVDLRYRELVMANAPAILALGRPRRRKGNGL